MSGSGMGDPHPDDDVADDAVGAGDGRQRVRKAPNAFRTISEAAAFPLDRHDARSSTQSGANRHVAHSHITGSGASDIQNDTPSANMNTAHAAANDARNNPLMNPTTPLRHNIEPTCAAEKHSPAKPTQYSGIRAITARNECVLKSNG